MTTIPPQAVIADEVMLTLSTVDGTGTEYYSGGV
jgi:hypothetical protein